jgi:hypothetical protein
VVAGDAVPAVEHRQRAAGEVGLPLLLGGAGGAGGDAPVHLGDVDRDVRLAPGVDDRDLLGEAVAEVAQGLGGRVAAAVGVQREAVDRRAGGADGVDRLGQPGVALLPAHAGDHAAGADRRDE